LKCAITLRREFHDVLSGGDKLFGSIIGIAGAKSTQ